VVSAVLDDNKTYKMGSFYIDNVRDNSRVTIRTSITDGQLTATYQIGAGDIVPVGGLDIII
jgi:hypothetical protein